MKNLRDQPEVGKKRKWIRIGFDGVPYRMASQIIKNTIECLPCENEFKNKNMYQSNLPGCAGSADENNFRKPFENILLVREKKYMEKNILQALFKFCSHIFLEELADRLGFKSKKGKEFIINCGDHHLSWQILTIIYEVLSQELVYAYLIESKYGGIACNVDNLFIREILKL